MKDNFNGMVIMFNNEDGVTWRFGVIDTLQYDVVFDDKTVEAAIRVYEWQVTGRQVRFPTNYGGMPWPFAQKEWRLAK